jgi:hypothetical protein
VKLSVGDQLLVNDAYVVLNGEIHRRIALSDPGIDDYRNGLLWSPEQPTLIDAEIQLWYKDKLIDEVRSYTAMRCVRSSAIVSCSTATLTFAAGSRSGYWRYANDCAVR